MTLPPNCTHGPMRLEYITDAGYRIAIHLTEMGHYCGYVTFPMPVDLLVPENFEVHGGVTWDRPTSPDCEPYQGWHCFGFDCAHSGDLSGHAFGDQEYSAATNAVWRSFDYALRETISLHDQIVEALK